MFKKAAFSRFRKSIWDHYRKNRRDLPWRNTKDPYRILVSEIMLQQTQVSRVLSKYREFLQKFPDLNHLSEANFREVLSVWNGLGYNRRAKHLHEIAKKVMKDYQGRIPPDSETLDQLPGIGTNTAGSIAAFAFNSPAVFIETNIRRVFIHFFFKDRTGITDSQISPLIEKTLDRKNPRKWYFALMDYGAMLGKQEKNPNHRSKHYKKQSPFDGSNRQIRGMILKHLLLRPYSLDQLVTIIKKDKKTISNNLSDLIREKMVQSNGRRFSVSID